MPVSPIENSDRPFRAIRLAGEEDNRDNDSLLRDIRFQIVEVRAFDHRKDVGKLMRDKEFPRGVLAQ